MTLLTYAAAVTAQLRLGTSVLVPVIRNPVQLAKSLATLDQLSQGRVIVGVGIGGPHVPEATFGVSNQRRVRRFIETLEVLKAFWTQPRATFDGEFWRFENVPMEPKPVQRPHPPIWFGARTEIGLKRAGTPPSCHYTASEITAGAIELATIARHALPVRAIVDGAQGEEGVIVAAPNGST